LEEIMRSPNTRVASAVAALALFFTGVVYADPTTEARNLVTFCLAHPEACSISIDYQKSGKSWHIDYNGTRLNVLASTVKVVHLLTYADAVDKHRINPSQAVNRDDWAKFWIGRDGGALSAAFARFSAGLPTPPLTVTNDQIVSAMIQESDNAAPDYLLNKLGSDSFEDIIERYIASEQRVGYIDVPQSINADFTEWAGNPNDPTSGQRAVANYSGYASDEYRAQVDQLFGKMNSPAFVSAVRVSNGSLLPWAAPPPPAGQPFPLTEAQYEALEKGYFMRSNTRTYNRLMLGLLHRDLLPPDQQKIVEGFLDYRLTAVPPNPQLAPLDRYGAKDGSLGAYNGATIRTRTIYAENKDGTQVVFTVHLIGTPGTATDLGDIVTGPVGSLDSAVRNFALALATDPTFATELQTDLGPKQDAPAPSLIARVLDNDSTSQRIHVKVAITNIGTASTSKTLSMGLFFSNDGVTKGVEADQEPFPPLPPGETKIVDLDSGHLNPTKFFMLVIDPANVIPAVQKQDNPQFELVQGH
jgi:Beta-lactamase enzyme family